MQYNEKEPETKAVGERIEELRKEKNKKEKNKKEKYISVDRLCNDLHIGSRQTYYNWVKGSTFPEPIFLYRMCNYFDVDMEYLLCKTNCKHTEQLDINKNYGISNEAVLNLKKIKEYSFGVTSCDKLEISILSTLNKLLEHDNFIELLGKITEYCIELPDSLANNNDKMNYTLFGIQEDFKRIIDDVSDYKVVKENITKSKLKQKKLF